MSSYENYSHTSRHYDGTRSAVGVEIILGCLAAAGDGLASLRVLDAGCGTGNYARAIVDYVGRVEAIDMNEGMLESAAAKLAAFSSAGRVQFHRASITELPFGDASVDGAMINQVLHHLPDDPAQGWPKIRQVVREMARVTRPGGVLIINTCSHQQLEHGWWYTSLIPKAVAGMKKRHISIAGLQAIVAQGGFHASRRFVPLDAMLQGEHYFNGRGPLDARWRDGDSIWATVSPGELDAALARLTRLDAGGEIESYVRRWDARRPDVGQFTFIVATRG